MIFIFEDSLIYEYGNIDPLGSGSMLGELIDEVPASEELVEYVSGMFFV